MSLSTLQPYLQGIRHVPPRGATTALAAAAAIGILIPTARHLVRSYRGFLALGRGGMPYNVFGWLIQASAKLIARTDIESAAHFSRREVLDLYAPLADLSFLADPPLLDRAGTRPTVPFYVAPQRQASESASGSMRLRMEAFFRAIVRENAEHLEIRPSGLEGPQFDAVWLRSWSRDGIAPSFAKGVKGEVTHIHPEGSSHLTLGPRDAALVLERGWGQRHALSGVTLPWTYVLVYAPRNREEWEVWRRIVLASCSFMVSVVEGQVVDITYGSEEAEWE